MEIMIGLDAMIYKISRKHYTTMQDTRRKPNPLYRSYPCNYSESKNLTNSIQLTPDQLHPKHPLYKGLGQFLLLK